MEVRLEHVTKVLSRKEILKDINLEMKSGTIYGLRGRNGSGKTMIMRTICGLVIPTEGTVRIGNMVLHRDISFPESVGMLIENPGFIGEYSGRKNLEMLASVKNDATKEEIVELMKAMDLDPEDRKKFRKYSLGMKQKIGIIAALMGDPELIVLDEPINALDEKTVETVKEILLERKKGGALIVISCHDREELEYLADEIAIVEEGKITGSYRVGEETEEAQ